MCLIDKNPNPISVERRKAQAAIGFARSRIHAKDKGRHCMQHLHASASSSVEPTPFPIISFSMIRIVQVG